MKARSISIMIIVLLVWTGPILLSACGDKKEGVAEIPGKTPDQIKAQATYVGSTQCLSCHGDKENWGHTLHKIALRKPLEFSKYQEKAETFYAETINRGIKLSLGTGGGGIDDGATPDDGEAVAYYFDDKGTASTADDIWKTHYELGLGATGVAALPATLGTAKLKYKAQVTMSGSTYSVTFTNLVSGGGSPTTKSYPIVLTYGGDANFKQRYLVQIFNSKYTSPLQYNDKTTSLTNRWVDYNGKNWFTTSATASSNVLKVPAKKEAFDGNCAGCHFTGYTLAKNSAGEETADAVDDPNGEVDFDGDGTLDEINIGCEACHGPGSAHVSTLNPAYITNPANLSKNRADMVCGQCHVRGETKDVFQETNEIGKLEFPAKLDAAGNLHKFRPGDDIRDYYVWDSGIGTYNANFYGGEPSGGKFVASSKHHQQYIDILQGPHSPDKADDPTCFSCHDLHDNVSPGWHQVATSIVKDGVTISTDNNDDTLCLACHAGSAPFASVTKAQVAAVKGAYEFNAEMAPIKEAVTSHTQHYFDPINQDGGGGASRCSICHMPKTAKTALPNDISSHTFNTIAPIKSLSTGSSAGVRNSCNGCHATANDTDLTNLQTAYDAKFGTTKTDLYFDQWAESGHADYSGEPFNHWNVDGEVSTSCAKCHSKDGYIDYVADRTVDTAAKLGTTLSCGVCHTNGDSPELYSGSSTTAAITRWASGAVGLNPVTFPSGSTADLGDASNLCMACHQGRESKVSVDTRIASNPTATNLSLINIHYFAAAATFFGGDVHGGYEYAGKTYRGMNTFPSHDADKKTCIGCHLRGTSKDHHFVPQVSDCTVCHGTAAVFAALPGSPATNNTEIIALQGELYAGIRNYAQTVLNRAVVYDGSSYPYFFVDTNGNGILDPSENTSANGYKFFDATGLKAAYNYQVSQKEPCGYIHNGIYIEQLLYDSIVALGGTPSVTPPDRP